LKKVIITLSAILILILAVIIVLPSLFKDKIQKMAIAKANSSMNASFSYNGFSLSLIKSFPDFTATFYNISVIGKNTFEKDTLVSISEISGKIKFSSVFKKKPILIEEVFIDRLNLNFLDNKVKVSLQTILLANHEKSGFKFKPGQSKLNNLPLSVTGGFSMPSDSMLFDIQFEIPGMTIQQVFTMVPDKYCGFLKSANASGYVSLIGKINGHYYKDFMPGIDIRLKINNGALRYPGLPEELKINEAITTIFKPEGNMDSLTMGIDIMNLQLAENPVNITATFKSARTDPTVDAKLNGTIDLGTLTKVFPIDSVIVKGFITADATFSGKISDIKSNNFDKFISTGNFKLKDFYFQSGSLPLGVSISQGTAELKNQDLKIDIKQLLYDHINITDFNGKMELKNQKIILSDLGMNMLGGTLKINGTVISHGRQNQYADFDIDAKGFDLSSAYRDLTVVQKYLPFAEKTEGKLSMTFNMQSKIGEKLKIEPSSVIAKGSFSTENVKITDHQSFNSLKSVIQPSNLKNLNLDNLTAEFEIKEGILHLEPFKTSLAEQPLIIGGNYNMCGTLDFRIDGTLDREILSTEIQNIISYMPGHESITKVDVGVNISGDLKKPDVKIDIDKIRKQVVDHVKKSSPQEIKDAVKKLLNKYFN
jgi:hypothetical protein